MKISQMKYVLMFLYGLMANSVQAHVLLVEQYDDYWSSNLSELIVYAANHDASTTALWSQIDFTDDPSGFSGDMPGSNPWPSATSLDSANLWHAVNEYFFVHITGMFSTSVADTYSFRTYNDDGVFVSIDGDLVINDPTLHPALRFEGAKALDVGIHTVDLYFFERWGAASLEFTVADSSLNYHHFGDDNSPVTLISQVPEPIMVTLFLLALLEVLVMRVKFKSSLL